MSATQLGLAVAFGLPLTVVVAVIFWPSDYDD